MSLNFDRLIPRQGTASVKRDGRRGKFDRAGLLPLWVADTDVAASAAVTRKASAKSARAEGALSGVTNSPFWKKSIDFIPVAAQKVDPEANGSAPEFPSGSMLPTTEVVLEIFLP